MKLSPHFTLGEFLFSLTANELRINNRPGDQATIGRLIFTAEGLERVREALGGRMIVITSGYRCPELNQAVGGQPDSQHVKGEAVDFVCPTFGTPKEIVQHLSPKITILGIDQIICEGSWVHVSFTANPRHQVLSLVNGRFVKGVA